MKPLSRLVLFMIVFVSWQWAWGQKTTIYTVSSSPYNNYPSLAFNSDWKVGPVFDVTGVQYFIGVKSLDFGYVDYSIIKVDKGKLTSIDIPYLMSSKDSQSPRSVDFSFFTIDKKNNIWIKHNAEGAIYRMDSQGVWYAYYYNSDHLNRRSKTLPNLLSVTMDIPLLFANDNNSKLWVFDNSGIIHNFDGSKWSKSIDLTKVSSEFLNGVVNVPSDGKLYKFLSMDVKGNDQIWMTASGTGGQFALKVEGAKMLGYALNSKINNSTGKIYIDKLGVVWVFDGYQIATFDSKKWYTYPVKSSYDGNDFILDYESNRKWYLDFNTYDIQTFKDYTFTGNSITFSNNALSTFKLESNYLTNITTNALDESLWGFWSNKLVKIEPPTVNAVTLSANYSYTPTAPQLNQSITFKDESTGSPTSWAWDFGDGTTSTLQNPTKTYNKAGNYTVKLTINKQGATAASTTKSITITAEAATLALSTITHNAPVAGEQGGLNISTNTNWTANSNAAWLKVSPTSGNAGTNIAVNYTVEANTATAARTGIITFTAGTQTATFTVTQAGVAPSLVVSPTAPTTIAAVGSTVALSVVSNLSWSVAKSTNSDWLTVSPASGMGNQNVSVTASANATTAERSATLTFSVAGVANVVVTIRQAGVNASLSLSETSIKVNASSISIGILKLTTNTAWTASSDAEWLTIGPTSGNAGTNIELTWSVAINTSVNSRTGKITVMAGTQTATFTVTQAGIIPELSLSAESKTVAATGEAGQLGITSNVPWSATSNATWLTFSPSSGGAGVINNFRYGIDANPNTTTRTGVITFSASGLIKTFTVTQEGTKPTPPQAPTQLTVTATSEYELRISWKDNATNETSYELERADGLLLGPTNSDFKKIATLPANTTTVLDQKLTSKSQYCYRVRAVNAVGASDFMEAVCGTTNAPPAGITLITHGFSPAGPEAPEKLRDDFTASFGVFANSIREKAGAGATVYINDVNTRKWKRWEAVSNNGNGDPTKEIILFYNWADASNTELYALLNNLLYMSNSGYLEGSADILFAMLADAQIPTLPNNLLTSGKPLHFIGHSRGTILLLQLMHRMAKWFPNVKIDHYTALDPHPATNMGDVVRKQRNTYASLPLVTGYADGCTNTIGCSSASVGTAEEIKIRIPENVQKAEVYYRKDGDYEDSDSALENLASRFGDPEIYANAVIFITNYFLPPWLQIQYQNRFRRLLVAFDGVPSIGGVNYQLDNTKISEGKTGGFGGAHSGVVSWYFGTIDTRLTGSDGKPISYDGEPLYLNQWYGTNGALLASKPAREKSGYYFSRIGGGYAQLADATNKMNIYEMDNQLQTRPRLNNTDGGMKLGIQNGNFEYNNDSGWRFGGGNSASNNQAKNGQVIVSGSGLSIKPEINITHSLMYYPANFNYVMAHIKFDTKQTATKTFSVQFLNRDFAAVGQPLEVVPTKNDTKAYIKIPTSLKGKSGSFTIKGTGILVEKVELSDRTGSQDVIIESLAQPETLQTVEALYEIFPNPNNGRFSLTSQDAQMPAIAVVVVDVIGNVLFKATDNQLSVFNAQQKLDIALPGGFTGSYTLRVETAQGVSFKRIIKE
ncbi:PKD repeat protein [Runella defluvii]|uniref:PKD repeat protein n=1 Tax=Runella defluvii TaxID=370973 RepID=A0A7W5ZUJ6_9BACT|nr:BACON domain-containing carbohydrate-binding protein [Runella defluvii]MBB3842014.1 PKD repeat protein [Runella defluvii]